MTMHERLGILACIHGVSLSRSCRDCSDAAWPKIERDHASLAIKSDLPMPPGPSYEATTLDRVRDAQPASPARRDERTAKVERPGPSTGNAHALKLRRLRTDLRPWIATLDHLAMDHREARKEALEAASALQRLLNRLDRIAR